MQRSAGVRVAVCVGSERPAPLEVEEETTSVVCRVLDVQPVRPELTNGQSQ